MHRIDADGHVNNRFVDADPALGRPGTRVSSPWLNAVNDELANAVEAGGIQLDKENNAQLAEVINGLKGRSDGLAERIEGIEQRVIGDDWTYPEMKSQTLIYPLALGTPLDPYGWTLGMSSSNVPAWFASDPIGGRPLVFPLNSVLHSGQRLTKVEIQVTPSSARAAESRISASVLVAVSGLGSNGFEAWDITKLPYRHVPSGGTAKDAGGTSLQVISLAPGDPTVPGALRLVLNRMEVYLQVTSGLDQSGDGDMLSAIRLTVLDPGPRNL